MNQERFVSSYIELLNDTIADAFQKNLVMQSQKKVIEEELEEVRNYIKEIKNSSDFTLSKNEQEIISLKEQLNEERRHRQLAINEINELRKNSQHIDTFKNQLISVRDENSNLVSEIEKRNRIIQAHEDEIAKLKESEKNAKLALEQEIKRAKEAESNARLTFEEDMKKSTEELSKRPLKKKDNIPLIVKKEKTEEFIKDAGNF